MKLLFLPSDVAAAGSFFTPEIGSFVAAEGEETEKRERKDGGWKEMKKKMFRVRGKVTDKLGEDEGREVRRTTSMSPSPVAVANFAGEGR